MHLMMNEPGQFAGDFYRRGLVSSSSGRTAEAAANFGKAVAIDPSFAAAQNNLGAALLKLARYGEAVPALQAAVRLDPDNVEAHFNLGIATWRTGHKDASLAHFATVVSLRPDFGDAYFNMGILLTAKRRFGEAADSFARTVGLMPTFAPGHSNLGMALAHLQRNDEAISSLGRALELDPGNASARAQRMYLLAGKCDWPALNADMPLVPGLGLAGASVSPFGLLALEDEPFHHLVRAQRFVAEKYKVSPLVVDRPASRPKRLKVGYFSADFREHAVMHLVMPLFEHHDRERFTIHGYSYGPPGDDPTRRKAAGLLDGFTEVSAMTDGEIAARARADKLDIAVDLQGHTLFSRLGIFAHRAAPLQVTFLGYPGSTGAPFIDYLVADRTVIPDVLREAYSERLIVLPNAYQPNSRRPIATTRWTRADAGLPESGFVFCCFNNSNKITPREFEIWMDLLRQVEGSVLWLLARNRHAEENLHQEAKRRGVEPERLIFAPVVPLDEHLARQRLADLFLDTFVYGAHTTASDALWAGLPVLTRIGKGFPARVGASLLRAAGLPELVTDRDEDYADLALKLAQDPAILADIRHRIQDSVARSALFDGPLFTGHIEAGFDAAHERLVKGQAAADIIVSA